MKIKKIGGKRKLFNRRANDFKAVQIQTESGGLAVRSLIVFLLIGVQLTIWICLHLRFAMAFRWWAIICFILSVITCLSVLSSNKNGLSKAVWIMFLLLCFEFSVPIYLLSDERLFFRKAKKRYAKIFERTDCYSPCFQPPKSKKVVVNDCKYLYGAGKFACYSQTNLKYFPSGYLFYEDLIAQIERAKHFIFMEYYIFSDGVLFKRIYQRLCEKIKAGVEVRLIYDDMGSRKGLTRKVKKQLKTAGVKFLPFNKLVPIIAVGLNYRDHRKIAVIDGKVAFTGGCNLADEYINEKRMHGYWKDNGVKIWGRAVDGFTLAFLRQWEYLSGIKEDCTNFLGKSLATTNTACVVPFFDGTEFKQTVGKTVYQNLISGATEKLYIMTPYFIPDDTLINSLIAKSLSGVDVRIVIPDIPDKNYVYKVTKRNAEKLVEHGIKVYAPKNAFVHAKVIMSENAVVTGSINFDLRSFYQQFESAVYTDDLKFMAEVENDFTKVFKQEFLLDVKSLRRKNIFNKAITGFLQLFAPLM